MIKPLLDFFDIKFPISTIKKGQELKDTTEKLFIGDKFVLKESASLLDALSINNQAFIPETLLYCANPEIFLGALDIVKDNYILDSKFDLYIPQKFVNIEYHTLTLYKEYNKYLRIHEYTYYFKKLIEKDEKNTKPLFSLVNKIAYFIGWTDSPVHIEIKL